jgi:excisionase family DNA binding protein
MKGKTTMAKSKLDHGPILRDLERLLMAATAEELPALLGELERLRLMGLARLIPPPAPAHPAPDPLDLLTVPDVARLLKRSRPHVFDLCRPGQLHPIRLPNGFRFRRADFEKYLVEHQGDV